MKVAYIENRTAVAHRNLSYQKNEKRWSLTKKIIILSVACRKTTYPFLKQDGVLVQKKYWRHAQNLAKAGVCPNFREGGGGGKYLIKV